ncbi:Serine/Threonine protein kinase with WD40 repeats [Planktothrix serta PCC 8927]|uniref:Serine/Threonine protein kinase with WD40 repeats n=1 Tax=Planktothrix serta PCC 8927 TaxID=671068 RepID=A0A7Z9E4K8_9CYAN|nr:serine/threonine-protein kinase [Planktothrix serta]VXD24427.1 Serine/Threonine protein kinase with WD40 repeats [Planktothrix serta PCC 8927]
MSYCLNPKCPNPTDSANENRRICCQCGSDLLLERRYRVIKQLGGGGFGKTFEIDDQGKCKVLKVLLKNHPKAVALFKQEAKVLSQLNHPGIPKVDPDGYFTYLSKGSEEPLHCLVMEKIEGLNLQDWMKERKKEPISQEQALEWLKQLAEILDQVHRLQYFHRDIKPQNIMRKPNGQLVLIDFGTAREVSKTYIVKVEQGQNVTGIVSPGYTPPEQTNGKAVPQSDFFALGRTFIYLLTGKPPTAYPENPRTGKLLWRKGAPNISDELAAVIDYLMAPFPGNRPQSPQAVLQCLAEIDLNKATNSKNNSSETKDASSSKRQRPKREREDNNLIKGTGLNLSASKITFPKIPLKYLGVLGTSLLVLGGIYTQIDGYARYGFIPANPLLILKSLPSSIFLQDYKRAVGQVYAVVISPNNQTLAVGSFGAIRIWDLKTDAEPRTIAAHSSWVKALAISPDGKILASGSNDKTIRLWDLKEGNRMRTIEGHTEGVNAIAFSPDGQTLASGSDDQTIRLWGSETGSRQLTIAGHEGAIHALAFSPDGQTLVSGGTDRIIRFWNLQTGSRKRSISGHEGAINALVYHPNSQTLISASDDGTIRLWNPNTGEQKAVWKAHNNPVKSLAITKDGKTLLSGGDSVIVWDLKTGKKLATLWGHSKPINALAVSSNGQIVVSGSEDKTIKIWQMP